MLAKIDNYPALLCKWDGLHRLAQEGPGYAHCASWIEAWLNTIRPYKSPLVFEASDVHGTYALGLLCSSMRRYLGFVPIRRLHLSETGLERIDELTIEFNGLLVDASKQQPAYRALFGALAAYGTRWDQLLVSGIVDRSAVCAAAAERGYPVRVLRQRPSYYVDLDKVREGPETYLRALNKNNRSSLKRALKLSDTELGGLRVEVATDPRQRKEYFSELVRLHSRHWSDRGEQGAFSDPDIVSFHGRLMEGSGDNVRLLRVCAGNAILSYAYNYLTNDVVYFYQSGTDFQQYERLRPGILSLYAQLIHFAGIGCRRFEFMAGEQLYKRQLATGHHSMYWLEVQRPSWRSRTINLARAAKSGIAKSWAKPAVDRIMKPM